MAAAETRPQLDALWRHGIRGCSAGIRRGVAAERRRGTGRVERAGGPAGRLEMSAVGRDGPPGCLDGHSGRAGRRWGSRPLLERLISLTGGRPVPCGSMQGCDAVDSRLDQAGVHDSRTGPQMYLAVVGTYSADSANQCLQTGAVDKSEPAKVDDHPGVGDRDVDLVPELGPRVALQRCLHRDRPCAGLVARRPLARAETGDGDRHQEP